MDDEVDSVAMIQNIAPIADVFAFAHKRNFLAVKKIGNKPWCKFFGVMIGTIVVAGIGDGHRQAVSIVPSAYQVIGGGFGSGIRAVRCITGCFGEFQVRPVER